MGHYRSEMGYEADDAKEAERQREQRARRTDRVREMIAEHGLEETLVRLLETDNPRIILGW